MERTTPETAPNGSAQPRISQPTARDRLASLQGDPPRHWSPAAQGPMPLSEALAARHHANRPWWRRAAQHIDHRIPSTLHGRWALSLPAAAALALVAIAGAAVGGWYLTRAQSTVVDVARVGGGGGNAGEAALSTTPPPDDDHATPHATPSAAANADGACRTRSWPPGTPPASASGAPAAWRGQPLRIVSVGAEPAGQISNVLAGRIPTEQARVQIVRSSARLPPAAMDRWLHAPITHRYARAMAARRKDCAPHTALATGPAVSGAAPAGAASAGAVVVDVEGKVAHPGIQTLPGGSRVYEALAAAGGALPGVDVTALDLARLVTDGEQLRVGIAGAPSPVVGLPQPSTGGAARGKHGKPAQPVNLNTATLEQLETVPDVGPALAQRILDWRSEHGRFESVAQLRQVRGIGERKFADMRDSVTV